MSADQTLPTPVIRSAFMPTLMLGAMAGIVQALMLDGGEGLGAFLVPGPILGLFVGMLAGHAVPGAALAFYVAGLATGGFQGHLDLLPFAVAFFVLPALLFAVGTNIGVRLRRAAQPRPGVPHR